MPTPKPSKPLGTAEVQDATEGHLRGGGRRNTTKENP